MKLLLLAALRNRHHLSLLILTFVTLLALTVASQMEMFALGVLTSQAGANVPGGVNPLLKIIPKIQQYFSFSNNVTALICTLVGVAVFKAIWLFASRYTTQILAIRVSRDLRQQYFEHIQQLPMSFYQKHNIGSLSSRVVGDAGQIATSINSWLTNYLQTPFTIASCLAVCVGLSWKLSLVIFIGVPLIILPIVLLAKRVKRVSRQLQSNQENFAGVLIDFLAGIQTVKIFSMEAFSLKKYKEQNDRMAILEGKTAKYGLLTRPILHAITTLCLASIVIFGLYGLKLPISELIVFCGLLQLIYEPVRKFADENANIQKGVVAAERMFQVLHLKPAIEDSQDATVISHFSDQIEFDHIWFRYGDEWVLKDLSFTVKKGQTVAIVGPTGSGKSTIVQLLPRLHEVEKGEIRIDGKPLSSYTQKSLREMISFVSQKPFFFSDTITANISYGREFPQEIIEAAAKNAHADEFICRMPEGYQSLLLEAGQNLSGGQQQRLAIARAFVKNAPILVLDEATSSLDAVSEEFIKESIAKLHGKVTQILIAHRLSTIEHADKIIYLEHGVKIAEGSKQELLETCPQFRLMWETLYRQTTMSSVLIS